MALLTFDGKKHWAFHDEGGFQLGAHYVPTTSKLTANHWAVDFRRLNSVDFEDTIKMGTVVTSELISVNTQGGFPSATQLASMQQNNARRQFFWEWVLSGIIEECMRTRIGLVDFSVWNVPPNNTRTARDVHVKTLVLNHTMNAFHHLG